MKIKETIVVEGRDDTAAIKRAVDGVTIETHGFGIRKSTWQLIEKAYEETGIIIFTDPDHSGEEIRRKLTQQFPRAKQAYLPRAEAARGSDIGIENAEPQSIIDALQKARCTMTAKGQEFTMEDLIAGGLTGMPDSAAKREALGKALGIGYGNGKQFLQKLNQFNITKQEFIKHLQGEDTNEALRTIDHKGNKGEV